MCGRRVAESLEKQGVVPCGGRSSPEWRLIYVTSKIVCNQLRLILTCGQQYKEESRRLGE
jgi:hypothetical protein